MCIKLALVVLLRLCVKLALVVLHPFGLPTRSGFTHSLWIHPLALDYPLWITRGAADEEPSRRFPWLDLARATGGETICGNELILQFDGPVTFGMWLESIANAEKFVYFEN